MISYGFTGTREGMTDEQKDAFSELLDSHEGAYLVFRHGGCLGADEDAHFLANTRYHIDVIVHPGVTKDGYPQNRGNFPEALFVHDPKPFLERNHDIVDKAKALIACPGTGQEIMRSGTWATVRYARNRKFPVTIIWPDGSITKENQ